MMARLLKLKKPIVEYFRIHGNSERKLNAHEWRVTNEVCSLLDVVAEVTIKIQGGSDTHISQTMFNMYEIDDVLKHAEQDIRTPDQLYNDSNISREPKEVDHLTAEAQQVRKVLLSKLEKKNLGRAMEPLERICVLLDPRRKDCSARQLINGSSSLRDRAVGDIKDFAKTFVELEVGPEPSAVGGSGGGGGGGTNPPDAKRTKTLTMLEKRRHDRLASFRHPAPAARHRRRLRSSDARSLKRSCGCTWRKTFSPRTTASRFSSSGSRGARPVRAP